MDIQTEKQPKLWFVARNIGIIFFLILAVDTGRGIILPTLIDYVLKNGGSTAFAGLVYAVNPVGRVSGVLFGTMLQKVDTRFVFLACALIGAIGHCIYAIAPAISSGAAVKWVILVGRFISGISAGCMAAIRTFIAIISPQKYKGNVTHIFNWDAICWIWLDPFFGLFLC